MIPSPLVTGSACCIPYGHLEKFYGRIGFKIIDEKDSPKFFKKEFKNIAKNLLIFL
jgi:hypothetical protein